MVELTAFVVKKITQQRTRERMGIKRNEIGHLRKIESGCLWKPPVMFSLLVLHRLEKEIIDSTNRKHDV